jgi:hypothetical protein
MATKYRVVERLYAHGGTDYVIESSYKIFWFFTRWENRLGKLQEYNDKQFAIKMVDYLNQNVQIKKKVAYP